MKTNFFLLFLFTGFLVIFSPEIVAQYDLDRPSLTVRAEDGLPNYYFRGLKMDPFGFVWIGSYDGLSRFDGRHIEVFRHQPDDSSSLAHNAINGLAIDPMSGKVWVATYGGLSAYDPATGKFKSYYQEASDSTSLPTNFVQWVYVDRQGEVWLASGSNALCHFDSEEEAFFRYLPATIQEGTTPGEQGSGEKIRTVIQDLHNDSLLWISTDRRFFSFNKYSLTFDFERPKWSNISQIFTHVDGNLYLLNEEGRLYVYDPQKNEALRELKLRESWSIFRVFRRSDRELWLSCNNGVTVLNTDDFSTSYPWENVAGEKKSYEIDLVDPQGRLWSAGSSGLKVFDPLTTQFQNYFYNTGGKSGAFIAQRIVEDAANGNLYLNVSGGEGLYRFDLSTRQWSVILPSKAFGTSSFQGVDLALLKDGQPLVLERSGLFILAADGRSLVAHPIMDKLPQESSWINLFVDSRGIIWLGGRSNGLLKINPVTGEVESLADRFPPCDRPRFRYDFFEDSRNQVWISNCSGFSAYSYPQGDFLMFPFTEGEPNDNTFHAVRDFAEDHRGILWVSSEEESLLGQVEVAQPEGGILRKFSLREQVKADSIRLGKGSLEDPLDVSKLAVDAEGGLWTISSTGLLRLSADRQVVEVFNDRDGLQWLDEELNVVTVNQIERLSTGEIVVGFRKGLSVFHPEQLRSSREAPRPYLVSFKVFNNEWPTDSSPFVVRAINLGYRDNYFSFDFASVGYTHPERFRYQYKLEGIDEEWVEAGARGYAAYTNVAGGAYTFLVRVANSDGLWNEEPLSISLRVAIPWWQQWWFRGSMLLLLIAGIYGYYRFRLFQVRKEERLKADFEKRIANMELTALRAQMNPHFIFNCLNSIESFILKNETTTAAEYLNDFSRLIRLILQNSRSSYVNLKDELEALSLYTSMERLRFNQRFDYEVSIAEDINPEELEIPPMLLQPFVENAIWHGLMHKEGHGKVKLMLTKENSCLKCVIEDDGIGRQQAAELRPKSSRKKSMGMNITKDRIDIINRIYKTNTSVTITDLTDAEGNPAGTRVQVAIPV